MTPPGLQALLTNLEAGEFEGSSAQSKGGMSGTDGSGVYSTRGDFIKVFEQFEKCTCQELMLSVYRNLGAMVSERDAIIVARDATIRELQEQIQKLTNHTA